MYFGKTMTKNSILWRNDPFLGIFFGIFGYLKDNNKG